MFLGRRVSEEKTTTGCSLTCQSSSAVWARVRRSSKLSVASCRRMSSGMHIRKMLSNNMHGLCEPSKASISSMSCEGGLSPRLSRPISSSLSARCRLDSPNMSVSLLFRFPYLSCCGGSSKMSITRRAVV